MTMTPHPDFESQALRVDLPSGADRRLALRPGAAVICTEGSVTVEEVMKGSEAANALVRVVAVRVNAGESHVVSYGGAIRLIAIGDARLMCLDAPGLAHPLYRMAAAIFRWFLPKNGNNRLGALHKISK